MYEKGKTTHKELKWELNQSIVAALEDAFYDCFEVFTCTVELCCKGLVVIKGKSAQSY